MSDQKVNMRIQSFSDFAAGLPKATVYYRESWDCIYFEICEKNFGMMSPRLEEKTRITLKGVPERNEELRELYESVEPGYYANKKHWNSIDLKAEELSDEEIKEMIRLSYELVVAKLPAKVRKSITDSL